MRRASDVNRHIESSSPQSLQGFQLGSLSPPHVAPQDCR